jgi:hypothetical protein
MKFPPLVPVQPQFPDKLLVRSSLPGLSLDLFQDGGVGEHGRYQLKAFTAEHAEIAEKVFEQARFLNTLLFSAYSAISAVNAFQG